MFGTNDSLFSSFISENRRLTTKIFSVTTLYFCLLVSLTFVGCAEEGKKLNPSDTVGLLGFQEGNQTLISSDDSNPGGVLPPIPPVVGAPAPPGQPLNAPILNHPQTHINNATVSEDPSGFHGNILIDHISFQLPVHNQTTVTAYIGKRNMMLEQDGTVVNATNFKTLTPLNPNGAAFWFNFKFPSDRKQKLILVARNEFGASSKEIDFSHNRNCIGAPLVPIIIGDCDQHCFEITNIAGNLEFKSKLKHGEITYLEFDFYGLSPKTGGFLMTPGYFSYIWDDPAFPPLQAGVTSVATTLNQEGKDNICLEIQSNIAMEDGNGTLSIDFFHSRVRLE
ncbi:hypothetical protein [Leptospira mtsangambouensis]|uniref:hypothetical protein n=1 Tax=Leptospira mtsangambouensis TaxID=2484912 RepID=UPI001EEB8C6A|nr:hypothetical protein [Leptospira mtsangambouensis]MCG6141621.1 hypothetical protein [Leptospira mtsangambouensis]